MSAFVARSALRATQRRQFSLLTNMRNMARTFEPHPFQRMTTAQAAKPDYAKMFKNRVFNATIYVPMMCAMLGWPYAAAVIVDGRV